MLWYLVGGGFLCPVKALKGPLTLGFAANNSIITIPLCLKALTQNLKVERRVAELVVPFSIIANRHGVVFLFAYTTVFLIQIYGIPLNINNLSITYLASILTGMAAEGHGAAIAPLLTELLKEVEVPAVLGPIVLTVTFPIIGRLENLLTIYATSILGVWLSKSRSCSPVPPEALPGEEKKQPDHLSL